MASGEGHDRLLSCGALLLQALQEEDPMIHYIDCGAGFISAGNHSINPTLLPEEVHPITEGYRLLAACLKPTVDALVLGMAVSSLIISHCAPVAERSSDFACTLSDIPGRDKDDKTCGTPQASGWLMIGCASCEVSTSTVRSAAAASFLITPLAPRHSRHTRLYSPHQKT